MTSKAYRDAIEMPRREGVLSIKIETAKGTHFWLLGEKDGRSVRILLSKTKSFATPRTMACTKLNMRRAIRDAKP